MNFFEHQAQARASGRRLVLLFLVAIVLIVIAVDFVVLLGFGLVNDEAASLEQIGASAPHAPRVIAWTSLITLGIIVLATLYKTARLKSGGGVVARGMGGMLVASDTRDPKLRRLRNVVEEIAIASGVPVPEIYVLEHETAINAFAAGYSPADAAVAVTRGTLDKLTRDELQGVIAHEFSHVLNGDMRLNIRLMGMVFGLLVLHIIGRTVLDAVGRGRRGGGKKGGAGAVALVALGVMIIGWIGVFFGRLIKAGVSRSREFLADASAVQFTRQSLGIAGALKKIAGVAEGSMLREKNGEEVAHMLFGDGVGYSALFATHPPLMDRIRRLDPQFKPAELQEKRALWNDPSYSPLTEDAEAPVAGLVSGGASAMIGPGAVVAAAGLPTSDDFRHAEAVHAAMPEALLAAAHDDEQALSIVFALLLESDPALKTRQLAIIEQEFGATLRAAVEHAAPEVGVLPAVLRLPLFSMVFPALRHRPRAQLIRLVAVVSELSHVDGRVGVFEFCLGRLLRTYVADALHPASVRVTGRRKLPECREALETLLSALAQHGHSDGAGARRAFAAGTAHVLPRETLRYREDIGWADGVDQALRDLDQLSAAGKELLLEALVRTIGHDGRVTVGESELLRVVCAALHSPLPPLVKAAAA